MSSNSRARLSHRAGRALASTLALAGLAAGGISVAAPATAAPSCTSGYVCFWTGSDGGGTRYRYFSAANHDHRTASVNYNYNSSNISFWTGPSGTGEIITHYTTAERGFRNWSKSNWDRCRSHRDYY